MRREKEIHAKLMGQKPFGPFKHFYGTSARYCASDNAYSLFLACGVPFEVCDEIPEDGWTFLADADALAVERGALSSNGSRLLARFSSEADRFLAVAEDFDSLFDFRRSIVLQLQKDGVPYVEEEIPIVVSWYREANLVYLWNLTKDDVVVHLRRGDKLLALRIADRDSSLVDLNSL